MNGAHIEVPLGLLKAGVKHALEQMSTGMAVGYDVDQMLGVSEMGSVSSLRSVRVTLVPEAKPVAPSPAPRPSFMKLAARDGERVA
jgi:hypothetical protein